MRESGQDIWWRRSARLVGGILATIGAGGFLTVILGALFGGRTFLGLALPYAWFALMLPAAILIAIFWFARRQIALDHRYDVTGDPS